MSQRKSADTSACTISVGVRLLRRAQSLTAPALGPSRLDGAPQDCAALLRAHVPPSRGPEADGGSPNWRWRQPPAGDIDQLYGEVEQRLRWKTSVPHDSPQAVAPSSAEPACEGRWQRLRGQSIALRHTSACIIGPTEMGVVEGPMTGKFCPPVAQRVAMVVAIVITVAAIRLGPSAL